MTGVLSGAPKGEWDNDGICRNISLLPPYTLFFSFSRVPVYADTQEWYEVRYYIFDFNMFQSRYNL